MATIDPQQVMPAGGQFSTDPRRQSHQLQELGRMAKFRQRQASGYGMGTNPATNAAVDQRRTARLNWMMAVPGAGIPGVVDWRSAGNGGFQGSYVNPYAGLTVPNPWAPRPGGLRGLLPQQPQQ